MIIAVGVDVVSISKIELLWHQHGARIREAVFTSYELSLLGSMIGGEEDAQKTLLPEHAKYLATRFAAKEATMKALNIRGDEGIEFNEIEVSGEDVLTLRLYGVAIQRALQDGIDMLRGSCCCSNDEAFAFVIGEKKR